jgi:hypothetical protein
MKLCESMVIGKNGAIYCKDNMNGKHLYETTDKDITCSCQIHWIGLQADTMIGVCSGWEWNVIKLRNNTFEKCGKTKYRLDMILKNPELLLNNAKVMTMDEIEEKLGCTIILKETKDLKTL